MHPLHVLYVLYKSFFLFCCVMSRGLHLSEAAFDHTLWPAPLRPPLAGGHHKFPALGMKPCHIPPPRACQLSRLTWSSLDPWTQSRAAMKERGDMSTLFIFIRQVTSRLGEPPRPRSPSGQIQPIREAGLNGKGGLDGVQSGLLSRQRTLWCCCCIMRQTKSGGMAAEEEEGGQSEEGRWR